MTSHFFKSQTFWWGLYYGLASIAIFLLIYSANPSWVVGIWFSVVAYILLPASFMIIGGIAERKTRTEAMDYKAAYIATFLIGFVGLMVSSLANPVIMFAAPEIQQTILSITKENTRESLEKRGMSDEQVEKVMRRFDQRADGKQQLKGTLIAFVSGLVWFAILALLAALGVKNVKKPSQEMQV